ncbi:MAG: circadian clock protein KaiB [Chthoniobacteraceae bacterium]|nr:circadian clock protein KaiB [Chthoniobacteraceae bacterium]
MSLRHRSKKQGDAKPEFAFRLYIAEGTPHSMLAVARLKALCEKYFAGHYRLEIRDVMEHPCCILTDRILATLTLIKLSPEPQLRIIGDLSEEARVLAALGVISEPP